MQKVSYLLANTVQLFCMKNPCLKLRADHMSCCTFFLILNNAFLDNRRFSFFITYTWHLALSLDYPMAFYRCD